MSKSKTLLFVTVFIASYLGTVFAFRRPAVMKAFRNLREDMKA